MKYVLPVLILTASMIGCAPQSPETEPVKQADPVGAPIGTIDGPTLAARLAAENAPLILDVRTPAEFAAGHIPGAVNIPHDELAQRMSELPNDKNAEIVVLCRSGRRALIAEDLLQAAGYADISDLDGHMLGWNADGRPVTGATP